MGQFMRSLILAVAVVLGLAASAHAFVLTTPLLEAAAGSNGTLCTIVNASSTKLMSVTIQVFNQFGTPVSPPALVTLDGGDAAVGFLVPPDLSLRSYCRFSGNFTGEHVRAAILVVDTFNTTIAFAPAY